MITSAFNLKPARWVIHAVGPVYGDDNAAELLKAAYVSSLDRADEVGADSVAFPSMSTGVYGYPKHLAAALSVEALRAADTAVSTVLLVAFDGRMAELWSDALG